MRFVGETPDKPGVTYKRHPEFTDYMVGTDGSVWRNPKDRWVRLAENPLQGRGYRVVALFRMGVAYHRYVHRLVLETFVGPRPPGMQACHFPDPTRWNNQLSNLRWDTPKANHNDRKIHGNTATGERSHFARLTEEQALEIRRRRVAGERRIDLAREFGIDETHVRRIATGKSWSHV